MESEATKPVVVLEYSILEEFSIKSIEHILKKSKHNSGTSSGLPQKRKKTNIISKNRRKRETRKSTTSTPKRNISKDIKNS